MVIGITLRQAKQTYDGVNWVEQDASSDILSF